MMMTAVDCNISVVPAYSLMLCIISVQLQNVVLSTSYILHIQRVLINLTGSFGKVSTCLPRQRKE